MVASTYEDDSRLTALTYPDGRQIDYTYDAESGLNDALSRIAQIKEDDGSVKTLADYKHLGLGMKVLANYVEGGVRYDLWGSTVGSYAGLDAFDRIDKLYWITDGSPDVVECLLEYGYNRNSLPTSCKDASSTTNNSHDYDALLGRDKLERLNDYTRGEVNSGVTPPTIVSGTATYRQKQQLDRVANWKSLDQDNTGDGSSTWDLEQTRTHSTVNEITGITGGQWVQPTYDASGNTKIMPKIGDVDSEAHVKYDAWNRIVQYGGEEFYEAKYRYDARGFRIQKDLYSDEQASHDATWHYYYTSSWQCIEEREQDPSTSDPPELRTQYLWGLRYIDDLIQRKRDTTGNGTLDETLYALNDRQFNTIALADPTTTQTSIIQRIVTTPYGQTTFLTSTYGSSTNTKDWQHVFQGLRTDEESGLIQNRYRVLHPLLGRFLQRDPLGYPDGMNAYAAYHVMYAVVDPVGLKKRSGITSAGSRTRRASTTVTYGEDSNQTRRTEHKTVAKDGFVSGDYNKLNRVSTGVGGSYYSGVGGGLNVNAEWEANDCCDANGTTIKWGETTVMVEIVVSIGLGFGGTVKTPIGKVGAELRVASLDRIIRFIAYENKCTGEEDLSIDNSLIILRFDPNLTLAKIAEVNFGGNVGTFKAWYSIDVDTKKKYVRTSIDIEYQVGGAHAELILANQSIAIGQINALAADRTTLFSVTKYY